MRIDTGYELWGGETISLGVNDFEGRAVFSPQFIAFDVNIQKNVLAERGEGFQRSDEYYNVDMRSVRIFKPDEAEDVKLRVGERWQGTVKDWSVSQRKTKDSRAIIYVVLKNLRRILSYQRKMKNQSFVVTQSCGTHVVREKTLPLRHVRVRFQVEGEDKITEVQGLWFGGKLVARTQLYPCTYNNMRVLLAKNTSLRREEVMRSVATVKTAPDYTKLPYVS